MLEIVLRGEPRQSLPLDPKGGGSLLVEAGH